MIIRNANIFMDGWFETGDIQFEESIQKIGPEIESEKVIDAKGAYLIPGLIDVHTHGAKNADASDGSLEGIKEMARYYAQEGVTSWCPTTMTLKEPELTKAVQAIRDYENERLAGNSNCKGCAKVAGIHMEGPFISKEKCGAQNPDNLALPDIDLFHRLNEASGGLIKLITIAPELPGAIDFIKEISKESTISLGHTTADYETAMAAYEAGASHTTHLYNAMPPLAHREPGVIGASFDSGAFVELITDAFHINPAVIRMTAELFQSDMILVSDSLRCAGMPDGNYELGGQMVTMVDGKAYMSGTNTIAGSSISLMEGLRRAVSYGIPLEEAILSATSSPAESIGAIDRIGSLEVGKAADMVLLDKELNIQNVFIDGKPIYNYGF